MSTERCGADTPTPDPAEALVATSCDCGCWAAWFPLLDPQTTHHTAIVHAEHLPQFLADGFVPRRLGDGPGLVCRHLTAAADEQP